MTKHQIKDIIEWDITNWSKALTYWKEHTKINDKNLHCLELGGRNGGISLWLALNGNNVICSDFNSPEHTAKPLHQKYKVENISYKDVNATMIPYENEFDVIAFKSILGSVCKGGKDELKKQTLEQVHKALKPGGKLVFAENLKSSKTHQYLRKKYTHWGANWNYLSYDEIDEILSPFDKVNYTTVGFFGAFGRSEKQRTFFGKIDAMLDKLIPNKMKYIVIGVAEK